MRNLLGIVVSIIFIGIIIISAKIFENFNKEISRKYMHIMLSNWWIIAMLFFDNVVAACIMPACFIVINYLSLKKNLITAMERDDDDENKSSYGTVYYAISLLVLAITTFGVIHNPLVGLCGIITMGYGDGLAAIIGKSIKSKQFKIRGNTKSVAGCAAMFLVTFIIFIGYLTFTEATHIFIKSALVATLMTVIEAVSIKGTDNLTVPLLTSLLAFLLV